MKWHQENTEIGTINKVEVYRRFAEDQELVVSQGSRFGTPSELPFQQFSPPSKLRTGTFRL